MRSDKPGCFFKKINKIKQTSITLARLATWAGKDLYKKKKEGIGELNRWRCRRGVSLFVGRERENIWQHSQIFIHSSHVFHGVPFLSCFGEYVSQSMWRLSKVHNQRKVNVKHRHALISLPNTHIGRVLKQ